MRRSNNVKPTTHTRALPFYLLSNPLPVSLDDREQHHRPTMCMPRPSLRITGLRCQSSSTYHRFPFPFQLQPFRRASDFPRARWLVDSSDAVTAHHLTRYRWHRYATDRMFTHCQYHSLSFRWDKGRGHLADGREGDQTRINAGPPASRWTSQCGGGK